MDLAHASPGAWAQLNPCGVYRLGADGPEFVEVPAPTDAELQAVLHLTFAHTAEGVSDGNKSRSQVATTDRAQLWAEQLHPTAVN